MKALMFRVKLLFRNDNGSLQDKCSLFHTSPRQQLGRKKMFTQLESQFWMIFIFDRDHASTVPGSRITEVVRKTFFQFSQSFKSILLSIISKIKQMPWWVLRVWQIITCFLKSGLRQEAVLPGLCKKESRGRSGGIHTVNIYMYKTIEARVNTVAIPTTATGKSCSLYQELLNSIPTGHGRNQPIYEHHVTKAGRNRVKPLWVFYQ